jgi:hypothetical protein
LSSNNSINPSDIEVHSFTTEKFNFKEFECEKAQFRDYLIKDAQIDQSRGIGRVFLFVYKSEIVGFVTVAMSQLPKKNHVFLEKIATHGTIRDCF